MVEKITQRLAEFCGIMTGDGHLSIYKTPKRSDHQLVISGDKTEEIDYFDYVSSLFKDLFDKELTLREEKEYARLYTHSKEVVLLLQELGLTVGKKARIAKIPESILENHENSLRFLKGLADTDFSMCFKKGSRKMHTYPKIIAEFASQNLIKDVNTLLDKLGISYFTYEFDKTNAFGTFRLYRTEINGLKNYHKWMNSVGFSNPKHLSKIMVWEKLGYCPPNTTYKERLRIIKGDE